MTKLPSKELLDGSKVPKTTTGEMKDALGKLRDYLDDLLGDDSADKAVARQKLGLDLTDWANRLDTKADKTEVENRARTLEEKIAERGVPVGSIDWFATPIPPTGYLKCDGSVVGRETYPELFAAIGTTFGEGDGEATFNLPDLIGKFAEGSAIPGTVKAAGLPDITGFSDWWSFGEGTNNPSGAFYTKSSSNSTPKIGDGSSPAQLLWFAASHSNPIYGSSSTVQPPALTLLPCIKAFDAAVNSGLIDVTELANEITGKADRTQAANLAMPSETGIALSVPAADSSIIAPADGYLTLTGITNSEAGHVNFWTTSGLGSMVSMGAHTAGKAMIPVRKGQKIWMNYINLNEAGLNFTYAEGSAPQ